VIVWSFGLPSGAAEVRKEKTRIKQKEKEESTKKKKEEKIKRRKKKK
jgi:hypothetical protein